jgi:ATP-dependent DNA helicase RecG
MAECPEVSGPEGPSCSANVTSNLLIKIENLVNCRSVEKQRLEFKQSWNNGPAKYQIIKTISAFANDYYNDNGGYIVIGVAENKSSEADEQIVLPPCGIKPNDLERIQKEILGHCKSHISPSYSPILSPEVLEDKHVLVIWAQASDDRPHKARTAKDGDYRYYIRKGPETTKASDKEIKSLLESSSKIPFDDRMAKSGMCCSVVVNQLKTLNCLNSVKMLRVCCHKMQCTITL